MTKKSPADEDILGELFHGCAFAAFVDQAIAQGGPPDCEATRCRAYRYYEEALAEKNAVLQSEPAETTE